MSCVRVYFGFPYMFPVSVSRIRIRIRILPCYQQSIGRPWEWHSNGIAMGLSAPGQVGGVGEAIGGVGRP